MEKTQCVSCWQVPCIIFLKDFLEAWIAMCWDEVLILWYFSADYILPVFLLNVDQGLMSVLVWVHLLMTYYQNKALKTSLGFGSH